MVVHSSFNKFFSSIAPYRCFRRVAGALYVYKAQNLQPAEIAGRLKNEFRFSAEPAEIEIALRESGVLSLLVSRDRLDQILKQHAEKISAMHTVISDLRKATTPFDVERIIAEGCIHALGYGRVAVYDVLLGGQVSSRWQWKIGEGKIVEGPAVDSFFAEPKEPKAGEAMDIVLKSGIAKVVNEPASDPACQVRAAQNLGAFGLFPGNGNIYMFDTMNPEVTIRPEDAQVLETIVSAGTGAKQRLKAEYREKTEQSAARLRTLISSRATDRLDLIRALLVSLTFDLGVNRAAFFRWRARSKQFKPLLAVGSLTIEEHWKALSQLKPGVGASEIFSLIENTPDLDLPLNELARKLELNGEIPAVIVMRGGKAYDCEGKPLADLPEAAEKIKSVFGSNEFVLVPIRTSRTTYGLLYLDNPWSQRDVDVEAVKTLGQNFISFWVHTKRQEDRTEEAKQAAAWAQRQIEALQLLRTWQTVVRSTEDQTMARKMLQDKYFEILRGESHLAGGAKQLKAMIELSMRRLLMPERMVEIEIDDNANMFFNNEWTNVLVEGELLEAIKHLHAKVEGEPPHIYYLPAEKIYLRVAERSLIVSDNSEAADRHLVFYEKPDLGEILIRKADQEMRDTGLKGSHLLLSQNRVEVRLL